jgi:hypothetical protein
MKISPLDVRGRWVLITGASSGIGAEYARDFARRGANLILVARRVDKLEALAQELKTARAVQIDVVTADLSDPEAPAALFAETRRLGRELYGLINNAGFAVYGPFHEGSIERNQQQILVNVYAPASLAQMVLPGMVARGSGFIVNVASTAAFQPVPYMANYGASKAFLLSMTEALWAEYRHSGVRILAVCPGATDTAFFDVAAAPEASVGPRDTPPNVVAATWRALAGNRSHVITGPVTNLLLAQAGRLLPRSFVASTAEKVMRPKSRRDLPKKNAV